MFLDSLRACLPRYRIEPVTEERLGDVLALFESNPAYFSKTQPHAPSLMECREDMAALPPGAVPEDKNFLAVYDRGLCVAVIDFIRGYPTPHTGFLGLFILHASCQGRGMGSTILRAIIPAAKAAGMQKAALLCHEVNVPGQAFWMAGGFRETERMTRLIDGAEYSVLWMEREL